MIECELSVQYFNCILFILFLKTTYKLLTVIDFISVFMHNSFIHIKNNDIQFILYAYCQRFSSVRFDSIHLIYKLKNKTMPSIRGYYAVSVNKKKLYLIDKASPEWNTQKNKIKSKSSAKLWNVYFTCVKRQIFWCFLIRMQTHINTSRT